MTEVRPFRALRYDPAHVDVSRAIVPPYDVIAPEEREPFFARDPHNAIRLSLTRRVDDEKTTDYSDVRATLEDWRARGILVRDPAPALYGLRQHFVAPDGTRGVRDGFFALLRLEDYERRIVRPHERTLAGPKADRLRLLRATRANLESIYLLYEDRELVLARALAPAFGGEPLATAREGGGAAEHTLVRVGDAAAIGAVREFLASRPVVIADGHHRYETALAYRDQRRAAGERSADAPHEFTLAYFANAFAPGSLLLPIHRLIRKAGVPTEAAWRERLPGWRRDLVSLPRPEDVPELLAHHLAPLADRHAFAVDDASGQLAIFSRERVDERELTVRVLHREVIEGVFGLGEDAVREGALGYPKDALRAARDVREGRGSVALYLNPLSPDDVFRVTAEGDVLPQKSTFFFPKLPTGLVFRTHEDETA